MKVGDACRPKGSNDEDWKNITDHWSKEIEEERRILQTGEPLAKVSSNSLVILLAILTYNNLINLFKFSFNRGLSQ